MSKMKWNVLVFVEQKILLPESPIYEWVYVIERDQSQDQTFATISKIQRKTKAVIWLDFRNQNWDTFPYEYRKRIIKIVNKDLSNLHHWITQTFVKINYPEEDLGENIEGYADKKTREQVGSPKVSYLSSFIKFGLLSIRQVHLLAKESKGPSASDKKAFHRELYFRDFYYTLAWYKFDRVYVQPILQQKNPKFIFEQDLIDWKRDKGLKPTISEKEKKEIEQSKQIFHSWTKGKTEYPLINAGIHQLTETGYMLNRLRMLTTSYLTQDNGLWWKYPEQFFGIHLTDYDWTINSMNHQNIAKIGLYPKYTLDFSIKRQEGMYPKDKEKYIEDYGG
jgi:hypothetical protein